MRIPGPHSVEETRKLFDQITKALVDDESLVKVVVEIRGPQTVIRLHAGTGDIGKLIGKQGRNARALRLVIGEIGLAQGVNYALDIVDSSRI